MFVTGHVHHLGGAVAHHRHQVDAGKVAGGVVEEQVLRTRIRGVNTTIIRAGVPLIDGAVELQAGVGGSPGCRADFLPQLAGGNILAHLAVSAADQLPVGVLLDGVEEAVAHPHRVVRVLARNREVGFAIPIHVVEREVEGVALRGGLQGPRDHAIGYPAAAGLA